MESLVKCDYFQELTRKPRLIPILYKNLKRNTKLDFANGLYGKQREINLHDENNYTTFHRYYAFIGTYLTRGTAMRSLHIINQSLRYTCNSVVKNINVEKQTRS